MVSQLPCKQCGTALSIVEGSLAQCFSCGTKNVYSESLSMFNDYLVEILNVTPSEDFSKLNEIGDEDIEERKLAIDSYFHEINTKYYDYEYLILTKLSEEKYEEKKLLSLIRKCGILSLIIDNFLLPIMSGTLSLTQFQELKALSSIYNHSLLGLYFSIKAKGNYELEKCKENYEYAITNYQNAAKICENIAIENPSIQFDSLFKQYQVLVKFTALLRDILEENPTYSSEKLEDLLKEVDTLSGKNVKVLNLYKQIEQIYHLGRDTSLLLEELRVADIISLDPYDENLIYSIEEIQEELNKISNWIDDVAEKYQTYKKKLLKLHSGKSIDYLDTYNKEFSNRKNKTIEKYDDLLDKIISRAIGDYNMETMEVLDILSDFINKLDLSNETIIDRFEIEHDDLLKYDEMLKSAVLGLIKKARLRDLESEYYSELITLISSKHSEFDNYILKFIYHLVKEFEEYRNENVLSLNEQRDLFALELKPNVKRLIDASFTLQEEMIPYPIFFEIVMLSKTLTVNQPEVIDLVIENPGLQEIKNVNISFFVPKSFKSKLRFAQLKKIKPNKKLQVETEVVPTEKGIFHFMVMIEYQSTGETFWMPSVKIELEVNEEF